MRLVWPALGSAALLVIAPLALAAQDGISAAAASISALDMQRRIGIIADDSMRGRDTPSRELNQVASYIASEFHRFGLKPGAGAGSYLQQYPLYRAKLDSSSTIAVGDRTTWRFGSEAVALSGAEGDARTIEGNTVVLAGTTQDPTVLESLGLAGAVVVLVGRPGAPDRELRQLFATVLTQRPAAIVVALALGDSVWNGMLARSARHGPLTPGWRIRSPGVVIAVRDAAVAPVLAERGLDLAALQQAAAGPVTATTLFDLPVSITLKPAAGSGFLAPNVVGILEGSDPVLKNEFVLFSAHMDHVGVGRPDARGDSIFNGADDDASGTAGVVEVAEAFAQLTPAPRRSLIFLTVSGEEKGLWGSEYFAGHSPVALDQIVADLNSDMIGRNWPDTIVAIGKEHSDLGATLNRVNQGHPELGMTAIDDIWPDEQFYRRSDHFNFASRGVPILFFFNGIHEDYHRPSDEVDRIDFDKAARITQLVFYLGLDVANAPQRPKWNEESFRSIVGNPVQ